MGRIIKDPKRLKTIDLEAPEFAKLLEKRLSIKFIHSVAFTNSNRYTVKCKKTLYRIADFVNTRPYVRKDDTIAVVHNLETHSFVDFYVKDKLVTIDWDK